MDRILRSLIIVLVGLSASCWSQTQVQLVTKSGSGTQSVAFTSSTTAGNLLVVVAGSIGASQSLSVSDTQANTWLAAVTKQVGTTGQLTTIMYAQNIAGGADTVTVTSGVTAQVSVIAIEYSGMATSSVLDQTGTVTAGVGVTGLTPQTSSSVSQASEVVIAGIVLNGNRTLTPSTGFSLLTGTNLGIGTSAVTNGQSEISSTLSGVITAGFSWTSNATGSAVVATFKASGGAVNPLPPGLTLTSGGLLSGIPNTPGTYPFHVQVKDSLGQTSTQLYSVVITSPTLTITSVPPPNGIINTSYTFQFTASGGTPPCCTWLSTGQTIPGLTLSSAGLLSGIPTTAGTYAYAVKATDGGSNTVSASYSVTISSNQIKFPQAAVNPLEYAADLASPSVTKHIINPSGGDYAYTCAGIQQAIVDAAAAADQAYLILIDPGNVPPTTGTCFQLKPRASNVLPSHFIILRSSSMPPNAVVPCAGGQGPDTPTGGSVRNLGCANGTDASHFWYVQTSSVNTNVIDTAGLVDANGNGPSHYVLQGFAASPTTSVTTSDAPLRIGTNAENTSAALPSHVHAAYFYIHGDAGDVFTPGNPPGNNIMSNDIAFNCLYCSLTYFYMDKSTRPGSEGHGIAINNAIGPLRITNFWQEGMSSGIFSGGATPGIPGIVAESDVEIREGTETYPTAWLGANWGSGRSPVRKNGQEIKEAQRVVIDGMVIENVDQTGGQGAPCIDIDVRSCSGGIPCDNYTSSIHDITISNTIMRNCLGVQNDARSGGTSAGLSVSFGGFNKQWLNNLFYNGPNATFCVGGGACTPLKWPAFGSEHSSWSLQNFTISSISEVGNTVTVTSPSIFPWNGSSTVVISGVPVAGYNGTFAATGVFPFTSTITYTDPTGGLGASSGGNVAYSGCTATRSGTTGNITVTCADSGTGLHQTNILVGDPVTVQNCTTDTTFNTTLGSLVGSGSNSGLPPALAGTTGLTVVYNNGSVGAGSATGCSLYNASGYWQNEQWRHNTFVIGSGVAVSTGGPYIAQCPFKTIQNSLGRQQMIQDNIWALDGWSGFSGNGSAEGSSGNNPAESCMDLTSFTFDHNAFAERNGANYTAWPSGLNGGVSGSNLWFPTTPQCATTTPDATCVGFAGMLTNTFIQNPSDYHAFELCGGEGSPAGCAGSSLFAGGQPQQAHDGTDLGANIPNIDAAQTLNTYNCGGCGTTFFPSH